MSYIEVVTRFALDPLALVGLVTEGRRVCPDHQLVAPNSLRSLAMESLLAQVRTGEMTEHTAMELHKRMTAVKIRLLGDRVSRRMAWQMALEQEWPTLQDAEFISVARLQADALVAESPGLTLKAAGFVDLARYEDLFSP